MVDENKKLYIFIGKVILNANERLELNGHFTLFSFYFMYFMSY